MVLTFGCAKACRISRSAALIGGAFALGAMAFTFTSARAQEIESGGCIGSWYTFNCTSRWAPAGDPFIRQVPPPGDAAERARANARDRRWVDRCRPMITPDRYGVARYHYALPGCEFGVGEN